MNPWQRRKLTAWKPGIEKDLCLFTCALCVDSIFASIYIYCPLALARTLSLISKTCFQQVTVCSQRYVFQCKSMQTFFLFLTCNSTTVWGGNDCKATADCLENKLGKPDILATLPIPRRQLRRKRSAPLRWWHCPSVRVCARGRLCEYRILLFVL